MKRTAFAFANARLPVTVTWRVQQHVCVSLLPVSHRLLSTSASAMSSIAESGSGTQSSQRLPKETEEGTRHGIVVRDVSIDPKKLQKKLKKRAKRLLLAAQRDYIREMRMKAALGMQPVSHSSEEPNTGEKSAQALDPLMDVRRLRHGEVPDKSDSLDFDAWLESQSELDAVVAAEKENVEKRGPLIQESNNEEVNDFTLLGVGDEMCQALRDNMDINSPTDIQKSVIPILMRKLGLLVRSHEYNQYPDIKHALELTLFADGTGTGKTLAYIIPLLESIRRDERVRGIRLRIGRPRALIMAPSRELCHQIRRVIRDTRFGASSVTLCAGESGKKQHSKLLGGVDIVVGTPQRVLQHLETNPQFFVSDCRYVVLDECDALVHECDWHSTVSQVIRRALPQPRRGTGTKGKLTKRVHIVGSSGTLSNDDKRTLCAELRQLNPSLISASAVENVVVVNGQHSLHSVLSELPLYFYECSSKTKQTVLLEVLKLAAKTNAKAEKLRQREIQRKALVTSETDAISQVRTEVRKRQATMVFCRSKGSAASVGHFLTDQNVKHEMFFGVHSPHLRAQKYESFIAGNCDLLICTDAAMRGLDTTHVTHVILYDFPHNARSLIHRVGRTGRRPQTDGREDRVSALVTANDALMAAALLTALAQRRGSEEATEHLDLISHLNERGLDKLKNVFKVNPHLKVQSRAQPSANAHLVPFEYMAVSRMDEAEIQERGRQQRTFRRLTKRQRMELQRREKILRKPSLWFYRDGKTRMPRFGIKKKIVRRLVRVSDDDARKHLLQRFKTHDADKQKRV